MKFIDFSKELNRDTLQLGYLVQGEDCYFRKLAVDRIVATANVENKELNYSTFEDSKKDDFLMSLNSYPLMSDYRLSIIVVDKVDDVFNKKLKAYYSNPNPTCIGIVVNSADVIKDISGITSIDCKKENGVMLTKWVEGTFRKDGKVIEKPLVAELIERCNMDMLRISQGVEMLVCYHKDNVEITKESIVDLIPAYLEAEVFDLVNAIVEKNQKKTMELYSSFKAQKVETTKVLALLYGNYRRMFLASISVGTEEELAVALNVKPYAVKKAKSLGRKYTKLRLKNCLEIISRAEFGIKSGKISQDEVLLTTILLLLES